MDEAREVVANKWVEAAGACNISKRLLKVGSAIMLHGLHAIFTAICSLFPFILTEKGLVFPIWEAKKKYQDFNDFCYIPWISMLTKCACLSVARADSQPGVNAAKT